MEFSVSMENPVTHYYHVHLICNYLDQKNLTLKMCAWTPGYYQILDYARAVENFEAKTTSGSPLQWSKPSANDWQVAIGNHSTVIVDYDVKAIVSFVGNVYLDETRGYITPGGLFMYTEDALHQPLIVQIKPYAQWNKLVATGLDSLAGKQNVFYAANYDVLFDSPFLMGKLEVLPSFTIKGIPHNFIGYDLGDFDRVQFMADMKKIVTAGINIIGDIPYTHYTFMAIGPGQGGIEHLNSTSLSFSNGEGFGTPEGRKRLYSFIAHEYFHNFNVKRIRPIALGPFDYSKENHTNMLWVSEGFTVYYEYMVVKRAGLSTGDDILNNLQTNIKAYENKPGHLFQSATQASYDTWADGPFGRTGDEMNRTISYYDKGPVLGFLLDLKIRHETGNKKSLDDVMRLLYNRYYKEKKRGFTDAEFKQACESVAGKPLNEVFEYASTVKPVNYPKYFAYTGLNIDTVAKPLPGAYLGIQAVEHSDSLLIKSVEWNSPAWNAGLRGGDKIIYINNDKANLGLLNDLASRTVGTYVKLNIEKQRMKKDVALYTGKKYQKTFAITRMAKPDKLQTAIYNSLLK